MHTFCQLLNQLECLKRTEEQVHHIIAFLETASPETSAWAVHLLRGRHIPSRPSKATMEAVLQSATGFPLWLIRESTEKAGNLAESSGLLWKNSTAIPTSDTGRPATTPSLAECALFPSSLRKLPDSRKVELLCGFLHSLTSHRARSVCFRLYAPGWPVRISPEILYEALASCWQCSVSTARSSLNALKRPDPLLYNSLRLSASGGLYPHSQPISQEPDPSPCTPTSNLCRQTHPSEVLTGLLYTELAYAVDGCPCLRCTLGLRKNEFFLPFTKVDIPLSIPEGPRILAAAKKYTITRFGPVSQLSPGIVIRVRIEGTVSTKRHKLGIQALNPSHAEWIENAVPEQIQTLDSIMLLTPGEP